MTPTTFIPIAVLGHRPVYGTTWFQLPASPWNISQAWRLEEDFPDRFKVEYRGDLAVLIERGPSVDRR